MIRAQQMQALKVPLNMVGTYEELMGEKCSKAITAAVEKGRDDCTQNGKPQRKGWLLKAATEECEL